MGLMDRIKNIFKNSEEVVVEEDDTYRKVELARDIVGTVGKIKRINSFDSSIWNLSNTSEFELRNRSLSELEKMYSDLSKRLSSLTMAEQKRNTQANKLEEYKWTGVRPQNMTAHEFDRLQKDDDLGR